ncbi:MAG: PHP domain-containing protein [Lentisphaeria bacterium]|nr:PHP domain-containing protein [Lentisphaeria bacterium]MBQ8754025.1 PHP domain-containing protein [Lentisphaeria bacterium]MBQ9774885.1 PHP domain-containing protein [Lentisphaeria bacterium]
MIDLHTHSTASDGSTPPAELLRQAAELGLCAVALTDHDTVAGIPEFLAEAEKYPQIHAVPGVELSTVFGARELHIVGLFLDYRNEVLTAYLEEQREKRRSRNEAIRLKLNSLGYPLSWDDPVFAGVGDACSIGRPHFARALMNRYGFPTMQSVFDKLLKRGCPAYVPRELPDPKQAIDAIHAAGGLAVWAHPVYRERNERAWAKRVIKRFAPLGLDAVEGYYSMFSATETALMTELAETYGVLLSGGSDFHGANSTVSLGTGAGKLNIPDELYDRLSEARALREVSTQS